MSLQQFANKRRRFTGILLLAVLLSLLSQFLRHQQRSLVIGIRAWQENQALFSSSSSSSKLRTNEPSSFPFEAVDDVWRLWQQYQQEHSVDALQKEIREGDGGLSSQWKNIASHYNDTRRFAVGYYSCPLQAGNRLHHFMNSLIWAVITNRTLLWKYYDRDTCQVVGRMYASGICQAANHETDCRSVLKRAEWLPGLDEWKLSYNLSTPVPLSYWTTHPAQPQHRLWFPGAEHHAGLAVSTPLRFVDFPQMLGQDSSIVLHLNGQPRLELLPTKESQIRAKRLFGAGVDYLYGMLFSESFAFQPAISVPPVSATHADSPMFIPNNSTTIRIVMHSRHTKASDDGSSIHRETLCLQNILRANHHIHQMHEPNCQVILLSDRSMTLQNLALHLQERYPACDVLVIPHNSSAGLSFSEEHGPFAGVGFYQDLAMVANQTILTTPVQQVAFVGSKRRSSSQLIREIMTYTLCLQNGTKAPDLMTCFFEDVVKSHQSP